MIADEGNTAGRDDTTFRYQIKYLHQGAALFGAPHSPFGDERYPLVT